MNFSNQLMTNWYMSMIFYYVMPCSSRSLGRRSAAQGWLRWGLHQSRRDLSWRCCSCWRTRTDRYPLGRGPAPRRRKIYPTGRCLCPLWLKILFWNNYWECYKTISYIPDSAVTWRIVFVNYFLRVLQLYYSCPVAQASKGNFQEVAHKTSSPRNIVGIFIQSFARFWKGVMGYCLARPLHQVAVFISSNIKI